MRILAGLLIVLALTGCSGAGSPAGLPGDQPRAGFPAGGIANQIEVSAVDRLALRSAALVAPDGRATPALSITANPAPTQTVSPQLWSGANSGALVGSGIGANALSPGIVAPAAQTQTRLLAVVSTASIAVPDPVAYRRGWRKYHIRLTFGAPPGEFETREIPAPEPPPPGP
ncbi:MAG TPA: hypothetical protein VGM07_14230 [Stellaceae bacterium]|jgi:hypothetical protein